MDWRHWEGYYVANSYADFVQPEYAAIRNAAALIDVSPLYKYRVRGPDATRLLNRICTRDVDRCEILQAIYTPWCDPDGTMRQEGTVFRLDEDDYQINAALPDLRWLRLNAVGLDVQLEDRSEALGALSLQGPRSRVILQQLVGSRIDDLSYFRMLHGMIDEASVIITRTGYTGDLGYEIWIAAADALGVWDRLIAAGRHHGITPCGLLAMDIARVEAGYILIEVDYVAADRALIPEQRFSPYQMGLGWAVHLDKGNFVGRQALRQEKRRGSASLLRGLQIEWNPLEAVYGEVDLMPDLPLVACRESVPVYAGARQVGRATTRVWSTLLKKYLAIATLEPHHAEPGTRIDMEVTVEHRRTRAAGEVVSLPHFRAPRLRA